MASWKLGGATIESGGKVSGETEYALLLGDRLRAGSATVNVAAPPDGAVLVDPKSDWLLDRYARSFARRFNLAVASDYEPTDEHIPAAVVEMLAELRRFPRKPGVIY